MTAAGMVLVDIETTGLEVDSVLMLEIGIVIVDNDFEVIDTWSSLVGGDHANILHQMHKLQAIATSPGRYERELKPQEIQNAVWVYRQHTESGLWERYMKQVNDNILPPLEVTAQAASKFLLRHNADGLPMSGSNVANFDRPIIRRVLPTVEELFHYRNVDISSVREFVRFADLDKATEIEALMTPNGLHRSVSDCLDTLTMFRTYARELGLRS